MELFDLIIALLVSTIGVLGYNKLKNKQILNIVKKNDDKIKTLEEQKQEILTKLVIQREQRENLKNQLQKELNREVSDEEIVKFLNDRYIER